MLSLRIALRYLLSRKSHGAVNVISAISLAAIAVASAAMVIVLSVFNGFTQLAESKLSALDPDFLITPTEGKAFANVDSLTAVLRTFRGVASAEPEISEQAFAVADGNQMPIILKGMTAEGVRASGLNPVTIDGETGFPHDSASVISVGVAMQLNLRPSASLTDFVVYEPRRVGRINPANPMAAFRSAQLSTTGVFQVEQEEYDRDVVIVPFEVAEHLLNYSNQATAIAVQLVPGTSPRQMQSLLTEFANNNALIAKDRFRQQEHAYRMIAVEKWITFVMLAFILVIASCNIISTLSMLILEKEENMGILTAIGATKRMINRIFINQCWLIVVAGGSVGIILGAILVLCQQHFGWIKLAATDTALMSVDSYPVVLEPTDIATSFVTLIAVALLITPVIPLIRRHK